MKISLVGSKQDFIFRKITSTGTSSPPAPVGGDGAPRGALGDPRGGARGALGGGRGGRFRFYRFLVGSCRFLVGKTVLAGKTVLEGNTVLGPPRLSLQGSPVGLYRAFIGLL